MSNVVRYMEPRNAYTAVAIRFVPYFRELVVTWTPNAVMSRGTERFVEEFLPQIRENNPDVKYTLMRTHTLYESFVQGIYNWERKKKYCASFKHATQILGFVEELSVGGDFRLGRKRGIRSSLPRGQELWNIETRGHDVFKVFSKWKGDAPDRDALTSETHPHYIIRQMTRKRNEMELE